MITYIVYVYTFNKSENKWDKLRMLVLWRENKRFGPQNTIPSLREFKAWDHQWTCAWNTRGNTCICHEDLVTSKHTWFITTYHSSCLPNEQDQRRCLNARNISLSQTKQVFLKSLGIPLSLRLTYTKVAWLGWFGVTPQVAWVCSNMVCSAKRVSLGEPSTTGYQAFSRLGTSKPPICWGGFNTSQPDFSLQVQTIGTQVWLKNT